MSSISHYYFVLFCFFVFKQKTAYEMRISDWSSDVCSSDLAGARHLQELREIIYPTIKAERKGEEAEPPGFEHAASERLDYSLELTNAEQITDLLAMTPHLYRASAEGLAKAKALTHLSVTVDVRLTRYRLA